MFQQIIAAVLSFLLLIMPWSNGLLNLQNRLTFDEAATWNEVLRCLEDRDIPALESMMRPWFNENMPDLTDQLNGIFDAIDGDVTKVEISPAIYSSNGDGVSSVRKAFVIYTTGLIHNLRVDYDVTNNRDAKDVGLSLLRLYVAKADGFRGHSFG